MNRFFFSVGLLFPFVLCIQAFSVDNLVIIQPPCSYSFGSIDFNVSGVVGSLNVVWIPVGYNGTHLSNLPNGTYSVNISDDISSYQGSWDILTPSPINITNQGPYWNTLGNWYKNLTEYVAFDCTHTTNPDFIGYPGGYGRWNATKEFGKVVSGGTSPYTYLWTAPYGTFDDPTALYPYFYPNTPMVLFNLTLTVRDSNTCQATSVIPFILELLNPVIYTKSASIGQNDGDMVINYEGKVRLYNYLLDAVSGSVRMIENGWLYGGGVYYVPSDTNISYINFMSAGHYYLSYDHHYPNNRCNSTVYFTIDNHLTFSVSLPPVITPNSSISIFSDGTPPFTWFWEALYQNSSSYGLTTPTLQNPGFTALEPVQYRLTVIDTNGIVGIMTTLFNPMILSGTVAEVIYCDTYTFSLSVSQGLAPYSVVWTPFNLVSDPTILNPVLTWLRVPLRL